MLNHYLKTSHVKINYTMSDIIRRYKSIGNNEICYNIDIREPYVMSELTRLLRILEYPYTTSRIPNSIEYGSILVKPRPQLLGIENKCAK